MLRVIRVHLESKPWDLSTAIYLVKDRPDGKRLIAQVKGLEWKELEQGLPAEPTLVIQDIDFRELKAALREALGLTLTEKEKHVAESELAVRREQIGDLKTLNDRLLKLVETWGGPHGRRNETVRGG